MLATCASAWAWPLAGTLVKVATVPSEARNRMESITPIRRDGDSRVVRLEGCMLILPDALRPWQRPGSDWAGGGRTKGSGRASK